MAKEREKEVFEEEIKELRRSLTSLLELCLPPKDVREEILRNIYTIELSLLRIFKTLIDYQVENLQSRIERKEGKKKAKKIEVE